MGKLIFQMMISADGFIEGENASLDWHLADDEFNRHAVDLFRNTSHILFGRRTYEMMYQYWPAPLAAQNDPEVTQYMNELPKVVCSTTMNKAGWNNTTWIRENAVEEIRHLKATAEKNLWLMGS